MLLSKSSIKFTLVLFAFLVAACDSANQVNMDEITSAEIANFSTQSNIMFASGQPTQDQVAILADAGIKHVISLRTEGELDWDESALVESLGMDFHSIPISGGNGLTSENAQSLESLLASIDGQPVLLHCGSSNRVGALKAITARDGGASIEDALAVGRRWGLTGLEERVRGVLTGS